MSLWIEHRSGLHLIPPHMRESVIAWCEKGEPHPNGMGTFLRAVLLNNFMAAVCSADLANTEYLHRWGIFIRDYMHHGSWGSEGKMRNWYNYHHPGGQTGLMRPAR